MKRFGPGQRMRLKLTEDECSLTGYVVFGRNNFTYDAICNWMVTMSITVLKTKLCFIDNLGDDPFDFIPRDVENKADEKPWKISPCLVCGYLQGRQQKFCHGIGKHHDKSRAYSSREHDEM